MEPNNFHPANTAFTYWREILTDSFIAEIKANGGILVNLANGEMIDWKMVEKEVKVIQPLPKQRYKIHVFIK